MRYRKILIAFLSAALVFPSVVLADSWLCYRSYNTNRAFPLNSTITFEGSADDAFRQAVLYTPFSKNASSTSYITYPSGNWGSISNITTGVYYDENRNPYRLYYTKYLYSFSKFCIENNIDIMSFFESDEYILRNNTDYYFKQFVADEFITRLYQRLTSDQLLKINMQLSTLQIISSDVSALVPALESHAVNVSNLAQIVSSATGVSTNLQHDIYNKLYGIHYALNEYPGIDGIYSKLDLLDPSTASSPWLLGQAFASVYGMETYPEQALVSAGLASNFQDAQNKLADPNWCHQTLAPAIENQRKKNALVQQLDSSGLTPPPGKSWRDLKVPELETIFEYNYNTPLADVTEVTTNWLPQIGGKVNDIASSAADIRDRMENGIFEVNVMNWPDDFFGFQVTLSNAFAEAFANLSITGRVIELDEDYKRYRDLYGLNGINAPSFDTVFSNAQFLAVGSPNDVNWWRESQNLLSYIAYYGTYNERIYNEIASTNFLAELAAITNRLSVLGDVEATVRRLTDDAIESGEDIKSTLENLTYYRGVSKWCDDYLQAGDTPDRVHLFDLDDHEFYIDIGQSYGFVDLIHGISAFAITLSWICTLPYMIIWLIEWFRKFADFWATKVVGP